jgi:hypothetical protein
MAGKAKGVEATSEARHMGGVFNQYLKALNGGGARSEKITAKIEEISAVLAAGTVKKNVETYKKGADGKRAKAGKKWVVRALRPTQIAKLFVQRAALQAKLSGTGKARVIKLRSEFLTLLPIYAQRAGFTTDALVAAGVPLADLVEAGLA